jgi:hypothetical protein
MSSLGPSPLSLFQLLPVGHSLAGFPQPKLELPAVQPVLSNVDSTKEFLTAHLVQLNAQHLLLLSPSQFPLRKKQNRAGQVKMSVTIHQGISAPLVEKQLLLVTPGTFSGSLLPPQSFSGSFQFIFSLPASHPFTFYYIAQPHGGEGWSLTRCGLDSCLRDYSHCVLEPELCSLS